MVNLNSYNAILTNLDRQKKRSFGATGDSQSSSQGSVAKSLRRDRNLERPQCSSSEVGCDELLYQYRFNRLVENDRPTNIITSAAAPAKTAYNDPLLQDRAFVTDPFDELDKMISPLRKPPPPSLKPSQQTSGEDYDQEIEDIITQMDEVANANEATNNNEDGENQSSSNGPLLTLRVEFSSKNFFWKGALLVFWGFGSCAENCRITTQQSAPRSAIKDFLQGYVHEQGGSSLTAICACAFRKILDLPAHQSYATLPACIIHVLPTFLGFNALKSVYSHHKNREMSSMSYTQPPPEFIPELGNVVHRTSPFLQLKHPSGELPGPAPYQRIATHLWIKYCVMDSHHYPESSFAFFKPGKDGTRTLLHVNGRRLRVSIIGTCDENSRPRKHRSRELWTDVMQECFDLEVVEFPEYIPGPDVKSKSLTIQTSHGSERLNLFKQDSSVPEIVICLNGFADIGKLPNSTTASVKRLLELDVPFVVVSWLLKSYDNGIFWSLAEYTINEAIKRQIIDKMNTWESPVRLEETINDDLGTGYWDDDVVMKKLPDDLQASNGGISTLRCDDTAAGQVDDNRIALCVSGGTWERYPAFPSTALTTLRVAKFGLCFNLAQLLYHQLCATAQSNLNKLLPDSDVLRDLSSLIEVPIKNSAKLQEPIFECLSMERFGSAESQDSTTAPTITIDHQKFEWKIRTPPPQSSFTGESSDSEKYVNLAGRLVLLPPEIDVWQNLTRTLDIENHCIWLVIKNLILKRVMPNLIAMTGKERFRVLRSWYMHTRDLSVAYEPEPIYLIPKSGAQIDGKDGLKILINNYCSTQKLRNRQDECCREVTDALTVGEGLLWQEDSTLKPISKLIKLIVEVVIDAIDEADFADPLNDIENDLLATIRHEFSSDDKREEIAGCCYGSQLGLRPIDLELSEEIHSVFDDGANEQRLNQELRMNTTLLKKYQKGLLEQAPR